MKKIINSIVNAYLIYKFWIIFLIILIFLTIGYFKFAKPVFEEHESYGYGKFETAAIDPMTGEIIPKTQIRSYDNSNKTILDAKGNEIPFKHIIELRDRICNYIKNKEVNENNNSLKEMCNQLLKDELGADFKIKDNDLYINNIWVSSEIDCRERINDIVKKIYQKQNNSK